MSKIFSDCIAGICRCIHKIGGSVSQLKPCRIGNFLFSPDCSLQKDVVEEIWDGVCDGFRIIDDVGIPSYKCANYKSITEGRFHEEMSEILKQDLLEGRIEEVSLKPHCVPSLGGLKRSHGHLRPIMDCSMPDGASVNNYTDSTCK